MSALNLPVLCASSSTSMYKEMAKKRAVTWGKVAVVKQGAVSLGLCRGQFGRERSKGGVSGENC